MIPSSAWLAVLSWMREKCHWNIFIHLMEYVKSALSGHLVYAFKCIAYAKKMRRWLDYYLLVMGYTPFIISSIQRKNKLMNHMHLVTMQFSMAMVTTMFRLGNKYLFFSSYFSSIHTPNEVAGVFIRIKAFSTLHQFELFFFGFG